MIRRTARSSALLVGLTSGLLTGCLPDSAGGLRFGDPAPSFSARTLDGTRIASLADYRGHTVIVNLWATWCVPCRTETPYLQSLFEQYQDRGLRIVGVSVDNETQWPAVHAFLEEMGVAYDVLLDPKGTSERTFRARGLPNSILINREGRVVFSWLGPIEEGDPTFLAGLEQALEEEVSRTAPGTEASGP